MGVKIDLKQLKGCKILESDIISILNEAIKIKQGIKELVPLIKKISEEISRAYKNKKKVILFGNGGSAADAQHIAAEFVGKFYQDRESLPSLAFHTNTSSLTATANDFGYDFIFERQVSAFVEPNDIVIGISTSGNSVNVIKGLKKANLKGAITIGMTGKEENQIEKIVDYCIKIPSTDTPRIQEGHITVGHIICYLVEKDIFGGI
ncbi:MAG: D-sedoheptulose-7-phosphate isomerase [Promethearchaeota archaeon]